MVRKNLCSLSKISPTRHRFKPLFSFAGDAFDSLTLCADDVFKHLHDVPPFLRKKKTVFAKSLHAAHGRFGIPTGRTFVHPFSVRRIIRRYPSDRTNADRSQTRQFASWRCRRRRRRRRTIYFFFSATRPSARSDPSVDGIPRTPGGATYARAASDTRRRDACRPSVMTTLYPVCTRRVRRQCERATTTTTTTPRRVFRDDRQGGGGAKRKGADISHGPNRRRRRRGRKPYLVVVGSRVYVLRTVYNTVYV